MEEIIMGILMISIIIGMIIVVFAVQNSAIVPIQFFIWSMELPLVLVIFCAVFAGALLMFFLALWRDFKRRLRPSQKITLNQDKDPIDISNEVAEHKEVPPATSEEQVLDKEKQ